MGDDARTARRDAERDAMVKDLVERGVARSANVIAALSEVPRHAFVPQETSDPYGDFPVVLKRDRGGAVVSTASQPTMIVVMLEALNATAGANILEIGTASGYNAALLSHLVGSGGAVTTVEIDTDLSEAAAAALRSTGFGNVRTVVGDGHDGWPDGAPYDRIIVTAASGRVEPAWTNQLVDGGRIVVPIAGPDPWETCRWFDKVDGALVERGEMRCRFVPMRHENEG